MAPYLENAVLPHSREFSNGTSSPPGCVSLASPTPGSLPPTESPPGLESPGGPYIEPYIEPASNTGSTFQYIETPVQTCMVETVAGYMSPTQQQSYQPQQVVVTTAPPPLMNQSYPTTMVQGGYQVYQVPIVQQVPYMIHYPTATVAPPLEQSFHQGETYQPVHIAIPSQYEGQVQYVQPAPVNSPVLQYDMGGPVQHMASPVLSHTSPSPHYQQPAVVPGPVEFVQPPQQPSPVYTTVQQPPVYVNHTQQGVPAMTRQPDDIPTLRKGESVSTQLEVIWHGTFHKLFDNFPMKWKLMPVTDLPPDAKTFMDSAKVRFICPNCNHCWTSMKGRVNFGYSVDTLQKEGLVVFRLYGQKCLKCESPDWVHSMWYEEEVKKVIHNIHQQVAMTYYNSRQPRLRIERRKGRPSKPHDPTVCQACEEGVCREEKNYC